MHAQDGHTPLIEAAQNDHLEMVRALLAGGADMNQAQKVRVCWWMRALLAKQGGKITIKSSTAFLVGTSWSAACWVLMHAQDGWTPLYVAAKKGHVEVVRALLEGGADVNKATKV